jgi:hypothetical protein
MACFLNAGNRSIRRLNPMVYILQMVTNLLLFPRLYITPQCGVRGPSSLKLGLCIDSAPPRRQDNIERKG